MSTFKQRLADAALGRLREPRNRAGSGSAQPQHDKSATSGLRTRSSSLEEAPSSGRSGLQRSRSGELHCRICDIYFSSETDLYLHRMKLHRDESPLLSPCPVCLVSCSVPYHLIRAALHRCSQNSSIERLTVDGEWPRPCPECSAVLHSFQEENRHYSIMSKHNRAMHTIQAESAANEWQRFCWPCDRYFALESELVQHLAECTSRLKCLTRTEGELLAASSNDGTEHHRLFESSGVSLDVNPGISSSDLRLKGKGHPITVESTSVLHNQVEDMAGTELNRFVMQEGEEGANADQSTLQSFLHNRAEGLLGGNGGNSPETDDNSSGLRKGEETIPGRNSPPLSSLSRVREGVRGMIKHLSGQLQSTDSAVSELGDTGQQLTPRRTDLVDDESGRGHFSTQSRPLPFPPAPSYGFPSSRSSISHSSRVVYPDYDTPPSIPPRPPQPFPPAASTAPAIRRSTRPDNGKSLQILTQPGPSEVNSTEIPPALPPRPLLGATGQNSNLPQQADLNETDQRNSLEEETPPSYSDAILQDPPFPPVLDLPQEVSVPNANINSGARPLPAPSFQTVRDGFPSLTPLAVTSSNQYECPLCFECGRELSNIPCGHVFCTSCILELLKTDPHCPVCRSSAEGADVRKVFLT